MDPNRGATGNPTDEADGQPIDGSVLLQQQHQDIQVQQQNLSTTLSDQQQQQQQSSSDQQQQEHHCSIVWLTSDQDQSNVGPLPPVSEVVSNHRSSRTTMHLSENGLPSHDSLQSYLTCSLPVDAASHATNALELMSAVTSMNQVQLAAVASGSSNVYSVAPSSSSSSSSNIAPTSEKRTHYHLDNSVHHLGLSVGHQAAPATSSSPSVVAAAATQPGTTLPNFAEVSAAAARADSASSGIPRTVNEQRYFEDANMAADVTTSPPKDLEEYVETLSCYKCKLCAYITLSREGVDQHVRATHSKLLSPELGEKPMPEADHEKQDPTVALNQKYICGICAKAFADIESCGVHMGYAHNLSADSVHLEPADGNQHLHLLQQQQEQEQGQDEVEIEVEEEMQPEFTSVVNSELHQGDCGMAEVTIQQPEPEVVAAAGVPCQPVAIKSKVAAKKRKRKRPSVDGNPPLKRVTRKSGRGNVGKPAVAEDGNIEDNVDNGHVDVNDAPKPTSKTEPRKVVKKRATAKKSPAANNVASVRNDAGAAASAPVEGATGGIPPETEDGATAQRCEAQGCTIWFRSVENLEYHRKCHAAEGFECAECMERFDRWKTLSVHLWREHLIDMELFACDLCSYKTYSYSKLMNLHRRIHSDERPYLCDACGKGFKTSKQMRNHKVIHLERKPQRNLRSGECDVCHRYFSDKRMLRVHKDTVHNKLRPYVCNYCGYAASCRSTLKMHVRQHTGEKPFACDICDYRTADHNSLRRHKMRHSGEKPYKCPFCSYACIQSSTYKAHLKNKHPGMDAGLMFCCDQCQFKTIKKENFVAHMADHGDYKIEELVATTTTTTTSATAATVMATATATTTTMTTIALPTPLAVVAPMAQAKKQQRTLQATQVLPVQVVLASDADVVKEIEAKLEKQESDAAGGDAFVGEREQYLYTEISADPHQENVHLHVVFKLEGGESEERYPILAGQLKRNNTPPLSSSSPSDDQQQANQEVETLASFTGHETVVVHHQELPAEEEEEVEEEHSDEKNDSMVLTHTVHFDEVGNVAVTNAATAMVHLHEIDVTNDLTAAAAAAAAAAVAAADTRDAGAVHVNDDGAHHGATQVVIKKQEVLATEVISHAQLTPVPPSEITAENGPILW